MDQEEGGLLEYIPGSGTLQAGSTPPLEGFAENILENARAYAEDSASETEKGHRFLHWVLTRVFEATEDDATDAIIDGANDLGIDAYLPVDFSDDTIRLFQSKYGSSHSDAAISKLRDDAAALQRRDASGLRPELAHLVTTIRDKRLRVKCCYVTDQDADYPGGGIEVIDGRRMVQMLWDRIKKPAEGKRSQIRLEKMLTYKNTILGVIRLRDLAEFVARNRDYVFDSNIRQWLQFKTTVNKGMRDTLQGHPSRFFYYNNGITIVVADFEEIGGNLVELDSPQIVNGAQTSNSILDQSRRSKNMDGEMTVTIIRAGEEEQNNITKYRNSQNSVRGKDLVSLMDFHKSVQSQLAGCGYFYEIQAGSFDTMSRSKQSQYGGDPAYNPYLPASHRKVIVAKDAIQALVAGIEQRPAEAYSSPAQFLPRGRKYGDVFNEGLRDDHRLLLYPYLAKEHAKAALGYGKHGGHRTKRYATLFFVAVYFRLLCGGVLGAGGEFRAEVRNMEPLFRDHQLNSGVLGLADTIVTKFLEDTTVEDEMERANTKHNFFSRHVWSDSMLRVVQKKMRQEEDGIAALREAVRGGRI
ncbi:MAG: AIPR family protein [Nitrosopumilus sp.]|nr:AIPR family protein [Nitrosopumilus sp.]CAI9832088.1 conserved hypothetical protein [Nitrosopumilaceae archaeon]MDA7941413.1 AIPR family protein [Nitrosopumilus sp.]MDA7942821.1 AIPR family protein [Nitrosopumilus sp.]MDA7945107.1 AIPR family protein [Nitrosopumilus sp.]